MSKPAKYVVQFNDYALYYFVFNLETKRPVKREYTDRHFARFDTEAKAQQFANERNAFLNH